MPTASNDDATSRPNTASTPTASNDDDASSVPLISRRTLALILVTVAAFALVYPAARLIRVVFEDELRDRGTTLRCDSEDECTRRAQQACGGEFAMLEKTYRAGGRESFRWWEFRATPVKLVFECKPAALGNSSG